MEVTYGRDPCVTCGRDYQSRLVGAPSWRRYQSTYRHDPYTRLLVAPASRLHGRQPVGYQGTYTRQPAVDYQPHPTDTTYNQPQRDTYQSATSRH
jgi:hypothetical protein